MLTMIPGVFWQRLGTRFSHACIEVKFILSFAPIAFIHFIYLFLLKHEGKCAYDPYYRTTVYNFWLYYFSLDAKPFSRATCLTLSSFWFR